MSQETPQYQRLPGRGLRRTGVITLSRSYSKLWLGPDHILIVDSTGYSEDYRRFYFDDIQAITLRKTTRGKNWNIALGALAFVFAVAGLPFGLVGAAIFWTISGLFLLFLLINMLRGPTCVCHLQTAVQRDELPSLGRLRVASKVLARIQPIIEGVQGAMTGAEVIARVQAASFEGTAAADAAPVRSPTASSKPRAPLSKSSGQLHAITFCLLLGLGAIGCLDFFIRHVAIVIVGTVLALATSVAAVIAVVRQHNSELSQRVQRLLWAIVVFMLINGVIGYVIFFVLAFRRGATAGPGQEWQYIKDLAGMSPFDSPFHMALGIFQTAGSWILGGLGLVWLGQFRRRQVVFQNLEATSASAVAGPKPD